MLLLQQQLYLLPINLLPHDVDAEIQARRSNKTRRRTLSQAKRGQSGHKGAVQMNMES